MDGTCQNMGTCSLERVNEVTSINTPVSSHPFVLHWLCYFSVADVSTIIYFITLNYNSKIYTFCRVGTQV
jgi:hypothetical protein